jgi:hypothetical protein
LLASARIFGHLANWSAPYVTNPLCDDDLCSIGGPADFRPPPARQQDSILLNAKWQ